ncbi:MAG: hypothetical protein QXL01_00325 [Thermoplasmatales archaeon]
MLPGVFPDYDAADSIIGVTEKAYFDGLKANRKRIEELHLFLGKLANVVGSKVCNTLKGNLK